MNSKKIILFIAGIGILIASIFLLSDDMMSPYVSLKEAKQRAGTYVQIIGKLDKGTKIGQQEKGYSFVLKEDRGGTMKVFHSGTKPLNFEHAEQIVILGRYVQSTEIFAADKVLVKCPSKYEKAEKRT